MNRSAARAVAASAALHTALVGGIVLAAVRLASPPPPAAVLEAYVLLGGAPLPEAPAAERAAPDDPVVEQADPGDAKHEPPTPAPLDHSARRTAAPEQPAPRTAPAADAASRPPVPRDEPVASVAARILAPPPAPDPPPIPAEIRDASASAQPVELEPPRAAPPVAEESVPSPAEQRRDAKVRARFDSWTGRFASERDGAAVEWNDAGQRYRATLTPAPAGDPTDLDRVVVTIATERDGERWSTELTLGRLAFSSFAQFVDRWDPDVQIHADEFDGRFHSNSEIKLSLTGSAQPVFHGKVTLASRDIVTDGFGYNRRRVFPEGLETGARHIFRPKELAPAAHDPERELRLERDAAITFFADGSYAWTYLGADEPERHAALPAGEQYFVGADGADLHVRGTLNGSALVYTPARIVIDGNLVYAADPRIAAGADDYLGLVAGRSVEIAPPNVTGPGDVVVHASIYAAGSFAVRDFHSGGRTPALLSIYGSVAAGTITATEPRFATKIEFDRRLVTRRAPGFPMTDRYELASWDGVWRRAAQ